MCVTIRGNSEKWTRQRPKKWWLFWNSQAVRDRTLSPHLYFHTLKDSINICYEVLAIFYYSRHVHLWPCTASKAAPQDHVLLTLLRDFSNLDCTVLEHRPQRWQRSAVQGKERHPLTSRLASTTYSQIEKPACNRHCMHFCDLESKIQWLPTTVFQPIYTCVCEGMSVKQTYNFRI